jgi:hypothetical protein
VQPARITLPQEEPPNIACRRLALQMTPVSLDADTGEIVFCEPGDLTPYSQPSASPLAKPIKITKPWVAMKELLITYLGIAVSIALLLTGPDEDEFEVRHVMATVFGWPLVALAFGWMAWLPMWGRAKRWAP